MNVFRLTGDMSHLLAVILLLVKVRSWNLYFLKLKSWTLQIHNTRSCSGLSLRSQVEIKLGLLLKTMKTCIFYLFLNACLKIKINRNHFRSYSLWFSLSAIWICSSSSTVSTTRRWRLGNLNRKIKFYKQYNSQIIYLITSYTTLYFMIVKFKSSYEKVKKLKREKNKHIFAGNPLVPHGVFGDPLPVPDRLHHAGIRSVGDGLDF